MGLTGFQGDVVNALNQQDARNQDLLDQVVTAANSISNNTAASDITMADTEGRMAAATDTNHNGSVDDEKTGIANQDGAIYWGGRAASISATGGVALLEFAKDAIQTAVSNISGMGTNQIQARKIVERKIGGMG